jgi:hypothetical protein
MTTYLDEALDWPRMRLCGRIRRSRRSLGAPAWAEQETHLWVSSLSPEQVTAREVAKLLREHWGVENGVFRVRDVSYDEDRLHGRRVGRTLSTVRHAAITLIPRQGYPYVPDGWRDIASRPGFGLFLLWLTRSIL